MNQASVATVIVSEWQPYIERSTIEVFNLMLNCRLRKGIPQLLPAPECTAMIGIAGAMRGLLTVRCGGATANQLAATMLKLTPERAAHYAADALGEIANMVAGNFKTKIEAIGDKSFLSIPAVVTGMTYSCRTLSSGPALELWFQFRGQPVQVTMQITV